MQTPREKAEDSDATGQSRRRTTRDELVEALRFRIVTGGSVRGERLPPRTRLAKDLGANPVTLQHAVQQLVDEKFLYTVGRRGTFVCKILPHERTVGIAFAPLPFIAQAGSRFWNALRKQAVVLEPRDDVKIKIYDDVTEENSTELADDIRCDRIGGLIGVGLPWDTDWMQDVIGAGNAPLSIVSTMFDYGEIPFLGMAPAARLLTQDIRRRGLKRVAVLYCTPYNNTFQDSLHSKTTEEWLHAAHDSDLKLTEDCIIPVHPGGAQTAGFIAWHLLSLPPSQRPQALVIDDDHIVTETTSALSTAGTEKLENLAVYGHANFPYRPKAYIPIRRYGYDIPTFFRRGLSLLRRQEGGKSISRVTRIHPLFEEDLLFDKQ